MGNGLFNILWKSPLPLGIQITCQTCLNPNNPFVFSGLSENLAPILFTDSSGRVRITSRKPNESSLKPLMKHVNLKS